MPSLDVGGSGCTAELPRVRVGVIRHQGETMLSPSHDVVPFLAARDRRWAVTPFDERDFGGALGAAAELDVIVLGYNAMLYTPELRAALEQAPPTAPILLLHQREQHCFGFLRDKLAVEIIELDPVSAAVTPRERSDAFEPLLNWPHVQRPPDSRFAAKAIRALSFSPDGAWRVVMEAQQGAQRFPVLIRTRSDFSQRMVACSLLLRPAADEAHGKLLENLLVYCAFGWPEVGLVELAGHDAAITRMRDLEHGMAMWTQRTVRVTVPSGAKLPIGTWPLQGVKRVVAPAELTADRIGADDSAPWFRRGGELIRVDADGRIAVTSELTDRFIVVRQWAMWFGGVSDVAWLERLSFARAVLRMLNEIAEDPSKLPADLRFSVDPGDYVDEVARLLHSRLRPDNVEETISATAAALDLDRLVGKQALTILKRRLVRRWLKAQLDGAVWGDQLDILRCLGERDLLREHIDGWRDESRAGDPRRRVDALVATRLREAVRACWPKGDEPSDLLDADLLATLDGDPVVNDLRHSPLLCADFVSALYSLGPGAKTSALFDPAQFPNSVPIAVGRVRAGGLYTAAADVRAVCAHTQAVLRHLERHPAGLRFSPEGGELPSSVAESVLEEATRARASEREARRDLPTLGKTVLLFATATLAFAAVGLLDLWNLANFTVRVDHWWPLVVAGGVPAVVLVVLRYGLRLPEEGDERRDVWVGQSALALASLALAAVPATLVWRGLATDNLSLAITLAPATGAFTLAALLVVLRHFGLVPRWATSVPTLVGSVTGFVGGITSRLTGPSSEPPPRS